MCSVLVSVRTCWYITAVSTTASFNLFYSTGLLRWWRKSCLCVSEHKSARLLPPSDTEQLPEKTGESGEDKGRSKTKQEASTTKAGRRKTWPERRRERREVKRLRREAHAMREGRLLGRARGYSDDEDCFADPLRHGLHCHKQSTPPPQKKKREETGGRKSKKHREAARWMKRGGIKRGELYPYGDIGIGNENLLSPRQRVRHRRRWSAFCKCFLFAD